MFFLEVRMFAMLRRWLGFDELAGRLAALEGEVASLRAEVAELRAPEAPVGAQIIYLAGRLGREAVPPPSRRSLSLVGDDDEDPPTAVA